MSATDVIRQHGDLRERFRDDRFREYCYANLSQLRDMPDDIGWRAVDQMSGHVAVAEDYYVVAAMMPAIFRRAEQLPADLPQIAVEPPSSHGFLVFEEPVRSTNAQGREETVTALTWGPGTLIDSFTDRNGVWCNGIGGRLVTCWTGIFDDEQRFNVQHFDAEQRDRLRGIVGPWSFSMLGGMWDGDDLGELYTPMDDEMIAAVEAARDTDTEQVPQATQRIGPLVAPAGRSVAWHRIIGAVFSLMNETIPGSAAIDRREPEDRATRRYAARMQLPGMVSIIRLRREEERHNGIETGRTVGVRYHVEGFYRTLHRGTADERRVWVHPHWRGPEEAPLSMRQSVRVLVR